MTEPSRLPEDWKPCSPGTILDAASRQSTDLRQSRRRFLTKVFGGTFSGVAISLITIITLKRNSAQTLPQPTGIACVQVHQHLRDFVANRIQDASLRCQISQHLFKCRKCRKVFKACAKGDEIYECKTKIKFPPIHQP